MKTIKLCEGHKNGYGLLVVFGQVEKAHIIVVSKKECIQCKANNKGRRRK